MRTPGKRYCCTHEGCNATFARPDRLTIHSRQHTGERPFVCSFDDCQKSYSRSTHLTRHEATHSKDSFKCSYKGCSAVLKTGVSLKKHVRNKHVKNKVYKCEECNLEFKRHRDLNAHNHKHTGIKPCKCSHAGCDKEFLFPSRLRRHMKVHEGYPCSYQNCDVKCSTWNLYRKHISVAHPSVQKCPSCSKSFSSPWNLKAHHKQHLVSDEKTVFLCSFPNCPRSYTEERNLAYHEKKCHILRPFNCTHDQCCKSFKNEEQLQKHLETHDPNTPFPSKKRKKKLKAKKKRNFASILAGYIEEKTNKQCDNAECSTTNVKVPLNNEESVTTVNNCSSNLNACSDQAEIVNNVVNDNSMISLSPILISECA